MNNILVVFHNIGKIPLLARGFMEGAMEAGAQVRLKSLVPISEDISAPKDVSAAAREDYLWAQGIVFGLCSENLPDHDLSGKIGTVFSCGEPAADFIVSLLASGIVLVPTENPDSLEAAREQGKKFVLNQRR
jgi:hypothetical protein